MCVRERACARVSTFTNVIVFHGYSGVQEVGLFTVGNAYIRVHLSVAGSIVGQFSVLVNL